MAVPRRGDPKILRRILLGGACALGVGVLLFAANRERFRPQPPELPAEVAAEIRSLRDDVAQLQLTMRRERQERAALLMKAAFPPTSPAPAVPGLAEQRGSVLAGVARGRGLSAERMEEDRKQQAETRARYFDFLNSKLTSEARDYAWAETIERKMKSVLAGPDFAGNSIREVECRRTLCKLVVVSADRTATHGLMTFATRVPDLPKGTYRQTAGDGGTVVTAAFFAKQDSTIPPPPKELSEQNPDQG